MATTADQYPFSVRREIPADGFADFPALHEWLAKTGHHCLTARETVNGCRYAIWHFQEYGASEGFMRSFGGEPWQKDVAQRRVG